MTGSFRNSFSHFFLLEQFLELLQPGLRLSKEEAHTWKKEKPNQRKCWRGKADLRTDSACPSPLTGEHRLLLEPARVRPCRHLRLRVS